MTAVAESSHWYFREGQLFRKSWSIHPSNLKDNQAAVSALA